MLHRQMWVEDIVKLDSCFKLVKNTVFKKMLIKTCKIMAKISGKTSLN